MIDEVAMAVEDMMTVVLLEVATKTVTIDEATVAVATADDETEMIATVVVASIDTKAAADVTIMVDEIDEEVVTAMIDVMIEVAIVAMVVLPHLHATTLPVILTAAAETTQLLVKIDMLEDRRLQHLICHHTHHDRGRPAAALTL